VFAEVNRVARDGSYLALVVTGTISICGQNGDTQPLFNYLVGSQREAFGKFDT